MTTRRFPIQDGPSVPWYYMEPHEAMAEKNHGQSLHRLAERGGLSSAEAELIVTGRHSRLITQMGLRDSLRNDWFKRAESVNAEHLTTFRSDEMDTSTRFDEWIKTTLGRKLLDKLGRDSESAMRQVFRAGALWEPPTQ